MNQIQYSTKEVEKALKNPEVAASEIKKLIGGVVERLQALKRKANESISDELAASYICKRKLQHLQEIASSDSSEAVVDQWKRVSCNNNSFPTLFIVKMRIPFQIRTIFLLKSYKGFSRCMIWICLRYRVGAFTPSFTNIGRL